MKVLYKVIGVSGWKVLFDQSQGAAVTMPRFNPTFRFTNQVAPGFGATSQSITPESNVVVQNSLSFLATYGARPGDPAGLQLALASVRDMRKVGAQKIHLQVVQDGEAQYYPNGSVESYSPDVNGAAVLHSFVFETQDVTAAIPTT